MVVVFVYIDVMNISCFQNVNSYTLCLSQHRNEMYTPVWFVNQKWCASWPRYSNRQPCAKYPKRCCHASLRKVQECTVGQLINIFQMHHKENLKQVEPRLEISQMINKWVSSAVNYHIIKILTCELKDLYKDIFISSTCDIFLCKSLAYSHILKSLHV